MFNEKLLKVAQKYFYDRVAQLSAKEKYETQIGWIFGNESSLNKVKVYLNDFKIHIRDMDFNDKESLNYLRSLEVKFDIEFDDSQYLEVVSFLKNVVTEYKSRMIDADFFVNFKDGLLTLQSLDELSSKLQIIIKAYDYYRAIEKAEHQSPLIKNNKALNEEKYRSKLRQSIESIWGAPVENISLKAEEIENAKKEYESNIKELGENYDKMQNFFCLYNQCNTLEARKKKLMEAYMYKQSILLTDADIDSIMNSANPSSSIDITPYEINRVFLHALITDLTDWKANFADLFTSVKNFINDSDREVEHAGLASNLMSDSYPNEIREVINAIYGLYVCKSSNNQNFLELLSHSASIAKPISQIKLKESMSFIANILDSNTDKRVVTDTLLQCTTAHSPNWAFYLARTLLDAVENKLLCVSDVALVLKTIAEKAPDELVAALVTSVDAGPNRGKSGIDLLAKAFEHEAQNRFEFNIKCKLSDNPSDTAIIGSIEILGMCTNQLRHDNATPTLPISECIDKLKEIIQSMQDYANEMQSKNRGGDEKNFRSLSNSLRDLIFSFVEDGKNDQQSRKGFVEKCKGLIKSAELDNHSSYAITRFIKQILVALGRLLGMDKSVRDNGTTFFSDKTTREQLATNFESVAKPIAEITT